MATLQGVINLAKDLATGKTITDGKRNFSVDESNDKLRQAMKDLFGFSLEGDGTIDRKTMRRHKVEIFEILEVVLNETLQSGLQHKFNDFAEYRNLAWGDTNLFKVPANQIFKIAIVSDGNSSLRRQRLRDGGEFAVSLDTYAIKIGEDFHRFLAGRVQWSDLMVLVADSFQRDLTRRVYKAMLASYGRYNGTYHMSGNLQENDLVELAMHIEARTGEKVAVYGTKLALRQLAPSAVTEAMKDERNRVGFYGMIAGIPLHEIEQSHEYETDTFAIDNSMILVLPQSTDKMIKIVNEGSAIIQDQAGGITADMMQEYFIANRFGISVITSKVFGFVKLGAGTLTPAPQVPQGQIIY
jgi:hypothetical protein